jgi:hypothetical protein
MRILGTIGAVTVFVAAALAADADPWEAPEFDSEMLLMRVVALGKGDITINMADKPWSEANGPARVELPLTREETNELARCRGLVGKGEHDAAGLALDALLAKNPAVWDAHLVRATSLHARKLDAEALVALRASLIGNRRNPDAWKLLDDVAKPLGKKVAPPKIDLRGWVRETGRNSIEVGYVHRDKASGAWNYYAAARAVYRWGGSFAADFPALKTYAFTFREQMVAMSVLADEATEEGLKAASIPADLRRVLAEKRAGTLAPFSFFAAYPEPLSATPEKGFELLRPRLEKYFDEKIVVKR